MTSSSQLRGQHRGLQEVGQCVASMTGYEYSNPPAVPSCGTDYGSVANGVALRRSIMETTPGTPGTPDKCGVCYKLTGAPELYDEATYQTQGNTSKDGWTKVVQVVDTAPNNPPIPSMGVELQYVFDLPDSIFIEASNPHAGANGVYSGHIPLKYEEVPCPGAAPTTPVPTASPTAVPTATPTTLLAPAPAPSGECCSYNYSTCTTGWCGESQTQCEVCGGSWILPDDSCLAMWQPCLDVTESCCSGLECTGNEWYKSCQASSLFN